MLKHLYYQIYTLSFVKWLLTGHQKQKKLQTLSLESGCDCLQEDWSLNRGSKYSDLT